MNLVRQTQKASNTQLAEFLDRDSFLLRAAAMDEISNRLQTDFNDNLLKILSDAVCEKRNRETFVRGTITVAHLGMFALARINHFKAREIFLSLLSIFKDADLKDLIWYLESEGISIAFSELQTA